MAAEEGTPMSSGSSVQLNVVHRKQEHVLAALSPSTTLAELRQAIEQATGVPSDKQKLLIPRSTDLHRRHDQETLDQVGLTRNGIKMTVVGPLQSEIQQLQEKEEAMHKSMAPRQYHPSLLKGTRARNTTTPGSTISPFGELQAHATTPPSSPLHAKVLEYLRRLSTDPGILHICAVNEFRIGILTELLPWEHPGLLGLNENMGQRISLRIRTDDAEGFRDYKTARRVLVHELAHNKINDHPPEFKVLNSKLNAQIEAYEAAQRHGRHTLIDGDFYQPASSEDSSSASAIEERRQRILAATMQRLDKEEHEIEQSCRTTKS